MEFPVVDDTNPFYCPQLSSGAYNGLLVNYGRGRRTVAQRDTAATYTGTNDPDVGAKDRIDSEWNLDRYFTFALPPTPDSGQYELPPYSAADLESPLSRSKVNHQVGDGRTVAPVHQKKRKSKRKSDETFTDFDAPPKYARTLQSVHNSSFELEVRRERLQLRDLSPPSEPVLAITNGLPATSTSSSLGNLIELLDKAFPGVRLSQRLQDLRPRDVQNFANFLCANDYVNKDVLRILGTTGVAKIAFNPKELGSHFELNLGREDIYASLSIPGAFLQLAEISFANSAVRDFVLIHLHRLPKLSILNLDQTGITNEGVYLLIPLKHTLTRLSLDANCEIDNNAVYALLLMKNLTYLSIFDTAIDMIGVRQIVTGLHEDNRNMTLKIPLICQEYLDTIGQKYCVQAPPPLITKPELCPQLSAATLKRNLAAHAAVNPAIVATGTRPELVFRLTEILQARLVDRVVLKMMDEQDCNKENDPRGVKAA